MIVDSSPENNYPGESRRGTGYFARHAKALFRSGAIADLGTSPVVLALFVASKEDQLHYRRPPRIWRDEISGAIGVSGNRHLKDIREKAVAGGLIWYAAGNRVKAGEFWTLVPSWLTPYFAVPLREPRRELQREPFSSSSKKKTNNPLTLKRRVDSSAMNRFDEFWSVYPTHGRSSKSDALKAWKKAVEKALRCRDLQCFRSVR